jgi:MATE family multidrug resistance protein
MMLGFVISVLIALAYWFLPNEFIRIYLDLNDPANAQTISLTTVLFFVAAFPRLADGVRNIAVGVLRGLHDTKYPMVIGLIASWGINIPLAYLFGFVFGWGVLGIRGAFFFGFSLGAALMIRRFSAMLTGR